MTILRRRATALAVGACCAVQVAIGVVVALWSTHNHFVWYSGGDATNYWTSSWLLAHRELPQALVSYGVPVLYAWVPPLTGASMLTGLPVITILQLVVLVPLATLLVWAVADLLFGRVYAWVTVALWILSPLLLLWGFRSDYRSVFRDLFLAPHWYGLTNMADLPSLVAVLGATWATLRLLERPTFDDGVLAGLLIGAAIAVKPSNGFFVPPVLVLLAATRRPRPVAGWAAGFVPALVALTVWKVRGLGHLPLTSYGATHEALGSPPTVAVGNHYVHLDFSHFQAELRDLGEVFWSVRVLEFLVIAGLVGALRRSPVKGVFLGVWCFAFCIVKGSTGLASIPSANYFRFVEPGLPAVVLLAAAVVLLVPTGGRPLPAAGRPRTLAGGRRTLAAAVFLLALVPLVVVAIARPAPAGTYARDYTLGNDAPLTAAPAAGVAVDAGSVRLRWQRGTAAGADVYYIVYRSSTPGTCAPAPEGAKECHLEMTPVGETHDTSFTDRPGAGRHWYRIGVAANYRGGVGGGDLMQLGPVIAAG